MTGAHHPNRARGQVREQRGQRGVGIGRVQLERHVAEVESELCVVEVCDRVHGLDGLIIHEEPDVRARLGRQARELDYQAARSRIVEAQDRDRLVVGGRGGSHPLYGGDAEVAADHQRLVAAQGRLEERVRHHVQLGHRGQPPGDFRRRALVVAAHDVCCQRTQRPHTGP